MVCSIVMSVKVVIWASMELWDTRPPEDAAASLQPSMNRTTQKPARGFFILGTKTTSKFCSFLVKVWIESDRDEHVTRHKQVFVQEHPPGCVCLHLSQQRNNKMCFYFQPLGFRQHCLVSVWRSGQKRSKPESTGSSAGCMSVKESEGSSEVLLWGYQTRSDPGGPGFLKNGHLHLQMWNAFSEVNIWKVFVHF